MKFNFRIPPNLKKHFQNEISLYKKEFEKGNIEKSWQHLERSHILGQSYPIEHTKSHWYMLLFGFKIKNTKEIIGQVPRLLVGGIKSFVGNVPMGNTGGANVPPLQPMKIPHDLLMILNQFKR